MDIWRIAKSSCVPELDHCKLRRLQSIYRFPEGPCVQTPCKAVLPDRGQQVKLVFALLPVARCSFFLNLKKQTPSLWILIRVTTSYGSLPGRGLTSSAVC